MKGRRQWTKEYIIGVDEAGRGPLAGPVAMGVSLIPKARARAVFARLKKAGLNDSKQVKEADRERIFELVDEMKKQGELDYAVALVSAKIISEKGISHAVRHGILKCMKNLDVTGNEVACTLEMDGALKVPAGEWKKANVIIRGDSIKPSIMIASIVAKVTRDRYMKHLAKEHPAYGFEVHKGYGTKKHREALGVHGMCAEHRIGWCRV